MILLNWTYQWPFGYCILLNKYDNNNSFNLDFRRSCIYGIEIFSSDLVEVAMTVLNVINKYNGVLWLKGRTIFIIWFTR